VETGEGGEDYETVAKSLGLAGFYTRISASSRKFIQGFESCGEERWGSFKSPIEKGYTIVLLSFYFHELTNEPFVTVNSDLCCRLPFLLQKWLGGQERES